MHSEHERDTKEAEELLQSTARAARVIANNLRPLAVRLGVSQLLNAATQAERFATELERLIALSIQTLRDNAKTKHQPKCEHCGR